MKKIVMTGGGTGGHVIPNLALIPRLQADGWEIHYIGGVGGMEEGMLRDVPGVKYYSVSVGKLRRYHDLKNLTDPFRVIHGARQARRLIRKIKPDVVFSKGGFVSVPVVVGAGFNRVPIVTHESDMTPGLANRLCLPFAKVQCCAFPEAVEHARGKGVYTGSPIREAILQGDRARGLERFGFTEGKPVLMITGGSSGAQAINECVRSCLEELTSRFQVLHLCGRGNFSDAHANVKNYVQKEFLNEEMADAYACADIVLSRAGANALFELLALRKPALLIPYPAGASRGDQIVNAESFKQRGFSHVLDQKDMTGETLVKAIIDTYRERGTLYENMKREKTADGVTAVLSEIYKAAKK